MLTDVKARKITPNDKTLAVGGVKGLYLRAGSSKGTGKFFLRFVSPTSGKRRDMGLGSYPELGLADARRLAMEAHTLIADGVDPIEQRNQTAKEAVQPSIVPTFQEAAERTYAALEPSFKNAKHSAQWINTLRTYAFPNIGQKPVDILSTDDFARLLAPIWLLKAETAGRVRQRCERVMTWCLAHRHTATNPVSAVDALLPKQPRKRDRVAHHPAVPWRSLPDVMARLNAAQRDSVGRDALILLILTATRSGEVRGACWEEFDLCRKIWTIPASRMKTGQQHRVPLSEQAIQLLEKRAALRDGSLVFSNRSDTPLSDMTLTKQLRTCKFPSDTPGRIATAHGFRSSFRDWASENGYPRDLAERALAHTIHNATEAAYHRTDQLEQRVTMMLSWADFVAPSE